MGPVEHPGDVHRHTPWNTGLGDQVVAHPASDVNLGQRAEQRRVFGSNQGIPSVSRRQRKKCLDCFGSHSPESRCRRLSGQRLFPHLESTSIRGHLDRCRSPTARPAPEHRHPAGPPFRQGTAPACSWVVSGRGRRQMPLRAQVSLGHSWPDGSGSGRSDSLDTGTCHRPFTASEPGSVPRLRWELSAVVVTPSRPW